MIEQYTGSVYSAIYREIPDNAYRNELQIYSFPQTWSSTALGFSGIGGQAFTTALTVVVIYRRDAFVYFGGRFAYKVKITNQKIMDDIRSHNMRCVSEKSYYDK